jgi:nucleotide-binding universal stress UspA family protein
MERFKSILAVVTEDSLFEAAFAHALDLARENDAALTLVDVIHAAPGELGRALAALSGERGPAIEDDVIAYHRSRLAALADRARAAKVDVSEAVLQGSGFVEIIRMVLREGHDIVIKGATVSETCGGKIEGGDMHLLRKCPCPVWMLTGAGDGRLDTVLAAIDPDPARGEVVVGLDRRVLELATSLAARAGATAHVIHAWCLPEEQALRQGRYGRDHGGEVDLLLTRGEAEARQRVADAVKPFPQIAPRHVHVRKGLPGDVITAHAQSVAADVIVMGTVGRTGLHGFVMGNTAETILNRVTCSVIAIKPEGFETPITLDTTG